MMAYSELMTDIPTVARELRELVEKCIEDGEPGCAEVALRGALLQAEVKALHRFAHWHDGVEYVGSCGTTLAQAKKEVEAAAWRGYPGTRPPKAGPNET